MIRQYVKSDYDKLSEWWKAWEWMAPGEMMLPKVGIISNEMAAGFLYQSDSPIAWVEWVISDKAADAELRKKSVDEVIEVLCDIAKSSGFKVAFTSVGNRGVEKRFSSHGFIAGDRNVTQMFKQL